MGGTLPVRSGSIGNSPQSDLDEDGEIAGRADADVPAHPELLEEATRTSTDEDEPFGAAWLSPAVVTRGSIFLPPNFSTTDTLAPGMRATLGTATERGPTFRS